MTTASNFVALDLTDNRSMPRFYVRGRYLERDMSWREILQLDYGLLIKNTLHCDFTIEVFYGYCLPRFLKVDGTSFQVF